MKENAMLSTLISLLILICLMGLIWWVLKLLPLPPPFGQFADVVFAIICIVVLLSVLFGGLRLPTPWVV
jgi:hypothetical protein